MRTIRATLHTTECALQAIGMNAEKRMKNQTTRNKALQGVKFTLVNNYTADKVKRA